MRKTTLLKALSAAAMLLIPPCQAEDITLADGTVLLDASIVRHDGESATIRHAHGVQRIPYIRLSPELQQRLDLTPEAVNKRRAHARQEEQRRAEAQEKKAAQQRAALNVSGLSPRYLTGADVLSLISSWTTLSASAAEYLAAEWNRREALRCGLTVEARRYKEDATVLSHNTTKERAELLQAREREAALSAKLQSAEAELRRARDTIRTLEEQLDKLKQEQKKRPTSTSTTVVVSEPRVVPVYQPRPVPVVIPPPPHALKPPPPPPVLQPRTTTIRRVLR